ncbi:MAG: hydrolase [Paenibacillus sp.]|nr:hydrolase [Paenibacillus sp.]
MTNDWQVSWFELDEVAEELIKYVVVLAHYNKAIILIRNKKNTEWELPGGKREEGESVVEAAGRELFEETGAIRFALIPFGNYTLNGSYGMVFYADVFEFGDLPDYEIEEIRCVDTLPRGLLYGEVYYELYAKWNEKSKLQWNKYTINYSDKL